MRAEEQVCDLKECRHLFHASCLDRWLEHKNECPLCKQPLDIYAAGPGPGLDALLLQANAAQAPFEQYFRNIVEVHQNIRALQDLRRARGPQDLAGPEVDREFVLAFRAIHMQFRAVQRNMIRHRVIHQAIRAAAVQARGAELGGAEARRPRI